jgi:hypothetical protein
VQTHTFGGFGIYRIVVGVLLPLFLRRGKAGLERGVWSSAERRAELGETPTFPWASRRVRFASLERVKMSKNRLAYASYGRRALLETGDRRPETGDRRPESGNEERRTKNKERGESD